MAERPPLVVTGRNLSEKRKMELGVGGLSGIDGSPVKEPDKGYEPMPTVTGPAVGRMVSADLSAGQIIQQIENIDGPFKHWWEPYTGRRPVHEHVHKRRPLTWREIEGIIRLDPLAMTFYERGANEYHDRVTNMMNVVHKTVFRRLVDQYITLMQYSPKTYMSPYETDHCKYHKHDMTREACARDHAFFAFCLNDYLAGPR